MFALICFRNRTVKVTRKISSSNYISKLLCGVLPRILFEIQRARDFTYSEHL